MQQTLSAGRRARATAPGHSRGRRRASVGVVVACALALPMGAAAQFSVQPVIVEMETGDSTAATVLMVRNESDAPLQLRFYAADFDQPEEGGHVFMAPGTHPQSCVDHLQFYPDGATLEPGETQEVRVLMEPVDSTCWSMVFVESGARSGSGLRIAQRIGVKVYGVNGRDVPEGEIRSVGVVADSTGRSVVIGFANLGAGPIRPEGEIEVRTLEGTVVDVIPVPAFSVLPGRVRQTQIPLELELEPGTYVLVPILDFGGDYLAGGQAVLEVPEP